MADEIEIVNVGGDGGVASEATLKQLLSAMNKMAGGGSGGAAAEAKARKLANAALKNGTVATNDDIAATNKSTDATKKAAEATTQLTERMGRLAAQGIKSLAASLYNLGSEIVSGTSSNLADFAKHVPIVGGHLAALASIIDESVSTYRDLSNVGASFNGSLTEMRQAAASSGMYLDEYTSFLKTNSATLAMFGGTVTEGAKRFGLMNKAMKSTGDFAGLTNLGFTVEQINEGMTEYIELQATQGRMAGRSNKDLAAGASRYMGELDKLSKLTGKSRQQLAEGMAADAKKANINALLAGMDTDQRESFLATMQAVEATIPGFKGAIEDLADGVAQTDLGQLLQSLSPQIADAAAALGRGELSQAEFMTKLKTEGGPALQAYVKSLSAAEVSALQNVEGFNELFGGMADLNKFIDSKFDPAAAEAEQKAAKARADKLMQFDNTIREVREKIKIALIDSGIFDLLLGTIGMVADGVSSIATAISGFVEKIVTGDVIGAIGSLFSGAPAIAAVTGGIAALFLGKAALGAMSRGIGGMATRMTSSLASKMGFGGAGTSGSNPTANPLASAGSAKGSSAGKGFGQAIGNIGKGLGQGIGGILKGLAAGLAAFANPAILIGAGILGGAIIAIGAGIAGATWLMGAALPKFAEGLKSFADIDGANLLSVAKGIAGVGAALAVFGAGAAIGAVGNVIANVLDALPGKSPLEKLKEFADADINTVRVQNNAKALVAYSDAMKGFSGGPAPSILAAFKTGMVSLLGGETDPMAPIRAFGEMTLNTAGIIANAGAVAAYAMAIKDFPTSPSADVFGAFKGAMVGLLGGETDPMAPIRAFGEMTLNEQGIIDNAYAVRAYADAVKDFPTSPSADVFGAFKGAMVGLLGGETDPMAPIRAFGEMTLNTAGIIANAGAVKAYADAVKDFPTSPSADVFGAFKTGLVSLLGGKTDPMAPIKAFGEMTLNTAGIIANATALSAYASAMKDFPASPSASVFTALKDGIIGLLGGKTDPFEPMKRFGDLTLNSGGITSNAAAVSAFASAMANMPQIQSTRSGGALGWLKDTFAGDEQLPWDQVKAFGEAGIDAAAVIANATALSDFSAAMLSIPSGDSTPTVIPQELVDRLSQLSRIDSTAITAAALGLQSFADVSGLQTNLDVLKNGLDTTKIRTYTNAIDGLITKLEELNETLSKDNDSFFGGDKASAGELLKDISLSSSSGQQNLGELTSIMSQIAEVLIQTKEIDEKIERNTQGFGSDLLTSDVTRY